MKNYKLVVWSALLPLFGMVTACINQNDICVPSPVDPGLHWESFNIYPLNDTRWATTRTNESIAVTNPDSKTQIMVTWEGGMSTGEKENPVLKIAQNGEKPQETDLKSFYLVTDEATESCTVRFQGLEDQEGTIKIPL